MPTVGWVRSGQPLEWRSWALRWRWAALLVVPVAVVAAADPHRTRYAVAGAVGVVLAVVAARHVIGTVNVLVVCVLFNLAGLALLYHVGLPASAVKALSLWKLVAVIGLALAVLARGKLRRPDLLEAAALVYVVLGTLYFLWPGFFVGQAAGAHLSTYERALGWRGDVFYILVFVVFRRLRLAPDVVDRLLTRFVGVAVVMALFGIFEAAVPSAFDALAVHGLGVPQYEHDIVGYQPSSAFSLHSVLVYSGANHTGLLRVGSLLVDYLSVGFVFAIALGIVADRLARDPRRPRLWVALVVLVAATVLTETRSAIVAAAVALLMALRHRAGKPLWARAYLARALAAGLVVAVPVVGASGILSRFLHAPQSNAIHKHAFRGGLTSLVHAPFGNGLGAAEGGAQILLAGMGASVVTEDQYLQIGAVMGYPGLLLYLVVVGGTLVVLLRRDRDGPGSPAPSAMSNAAVGCFVGALLTQAFTNLELSMSFWALAGMAVGVVDQRREAAPVGAASATALPAAEMAAR